MASGRARARASVAKSPTPRSLVHVPKGFLPVTFFLWVPLAPQSAMRRLLERPPVAPGGFWLVVVAGKEELDVWPRG